MKEDKYKYLPKFYDLETLTQEDLNKLALERNTLVKENERLNNIINELEKWLKEENYKNEDFWCINSVEVLDKLQELKEGK